MSWKKLLEAASESLNDHVRLRNEYLMAENRLLRHQIEGRVQLTDSERKELAALGVQLGKKTLSEIVTLAKPETILAWNRKVANQNVPASKAPQLIGRPRVDQEIEDWVIRMARENRSWGYDRIQGALNHLGYTISDQTVGNILKRHGISPAPERKTTVTWREFIRSHWDVLMATGFFNSEVWNSLGQSLSLLLSIIHFSCYQVQSVVTALHQQMLVMQTVMRCALDLSFHLQRWVSLLAPSSQMCQDGKVVLEQPGAEVVFAEVRSLRLQDMTKVVILSSARRPIRDGPARRVQPANELWQADDRKAA